jgi:ketosteroid isomerase-like protein
MADWRAELCREAYAAFQRLDSEAAVAVYDADCVWDVGAASAALGQQTYRGHDGLRQLMNQVREVFPDWHPVVEELRLRDDGRCWSAPASRPLRATAECRSRSRSSVR